MSRFLPFTHSQMLDELKKQKKLDVVIRELQSDIQKLSIAQAQASEIAMLQFFLGMAYFYNDQLQEAEAVLEAGLELDATSLIGLTYLGAVQTQLQKFSEANEKLKKVMNAGMGPELSDEALMRLGLAHAGIAGDVLGVIAEEKVQQLLSDAIIDVVDSQNIIPLLYRGNLSLSSDNLSRALPDLVECANTPSNFRLYYRLRSFAADKVAIIHFSRGEQDQEKAWLASSAGFASDHDASSFMEWLKLAYFDIRHGRGNEAKIAIDSALELIPHAAQNGSELKEALVTYKKYLEAGSPAEIISIEDLRSKELLFSDCLTKEQENATKLGLVEIALKKQPTNEGFLQLRAGLAEELIKSHLGRARKFLLAKQKEDVDLQLQQAEEKIALYHLESVRPKLNSVYAEKYFIQAQELKDAETSYVDVMEEINLAKQYAGNNEKLLTQIEEFEVVCALKEADDEKQVENYDRAVEILISARRLSYINTELKDKVNHLFQQITLTIGMRLARENGLFKNATTQTEELIAPPGPAATT